MCVIEQCRQEGRCATPELGCFTPHLVLVAANTTSFVVGRYHRPLLWPLPQRSDAILVLCVAMGVGASPCSPPRSPHPTFKMIPNRIKVLHKQAEASYSEKQGHAAFLFFFLVSTGINKEMLYNFYLYPTCSLAAGTHE